MGTGRRPSVPAKTRPSRSARIVSCGRTRSPGVPLAETLVMPEASRVPEMPEVPELWADRAFLRDVQYQTDANLAARQSIYAYQHPRLDLPARVLDLAAPRAGETVADVG